MICWPPHFEDAGDNYLLATPFEVIGMAIPAGLAGMTANMTATRWMLKHVDVTEV